MHARFHVFVFCAVLLLGTVPASVTADDYVIDNEASLFAVVIHKAGILSAFAHNHLVHAGAYDATLTIDGDDPQTIKFSIAVNVDELIADAPNMKEAWYPKIEEAGILNEPFEDISESNREKIREAMLSEDQLDAEAYPSLTAKVVEVASRPESDSDDGATHDVTVEITVHGETVTQSFPARMEWDGGTVRVVAHAPLRFTDFGIKPYKALLGSVKNRDRFDVYVSLEAVRKSAL